MIANTGSGWKALALPASFPTRYISGVAVDPNDATGRTAYVTLSGYARHRMVGPVDPGVGHVYRTTNGGASWSRVGSGLPNVITGDLSVTPDGRLLAATHGRGPWAIPLDGLS